MTSRLVAVAVCLLLRVELDRLSMLLVDHSCWLSLIGDHVTLLLDGGIEGCVGRYAFPTFDWFFPHTVDHNDMYIDTQFYFVIRWEEGLCGWLEGEVSSEKLSLTRLRRSMLIQHLKFAFQIDTMDFR